MMLFFFDSYNYEFIFTNNSCEKSSEYDVD